MKLQQTASYANICLTVFIVLHGCTSETNSAISTSDRPNDENTESVPGLYSIVSGVDQHGVDIQSSDLPGTFIFFSEPNNWKALVSCREYQGVYNQESEQGSFPELIVAEMDNPPPFPFRSGIEEGGYGCGTHGAGGSSARITSMLDDLFASEIIISTSDDESVTLSNIVNSSLIVLKTADYLTLQEPTLIASGSREHALTDNYYLATTGPNIINNTNELNFWLEEYDLTGDDRYDGLNFDEGSLILYDAALFGHGVVPPLLLESYRRTANSLIFQVTLEEPYGCGKSIFDADVSEITDLGSYALWHFPNIKFDSAFVVDRTRLDTTGNIARCSED